VAVALIAAAAGITAVVAQTSGSSSRSERPKVHQRPRLEPYAQNPLTVKGTGFRPHEHIRVAVKGVDRPVALEVRADARGLFVAAFRHVNGCDSVTVAAAGSMGSSASFNVSQIACIEP
jgi:hypothetical protein